MVIGGWTTTGPAFRSLIVGAYRDGKLIHLGRVGTGFGKQKLERLLPALKANEAKTSPFAGALNLRAGENADDALRQALVSLIALSLDNESLAA